MTAHDPDHYKGAVECIDAIRASMTAEAFAGYLKGNIQKYLWRYEKKNGVEDLRKAGVYLNWLIEHEDTRNNERHERGKLPPPVCSTP
jgi:hypothetical protein